MNNIIVRLSIAALAAAALAACGGGGSSAPTPAALKSSGSGSAGNSAGATASYANGTTKVTFAIPAAPNTQHTNPAVKAKKGTVNAKLAARKAAARKSPTYVSYYTQGLQVTITAGGSTSIYNYVYSRNQCQYNGTEYICQVVVPTNGTSETLTIAMVDQAPTGGTPDQYGNSAGSLFPFGSAILSIGSATVTPTPGQITLVNLSVNPVIGQWYDCGVYGLGAQQVQEDWDGSLNEERIVMQGDVATTALVESVPNDWDEASIYNPVTTPNGGANTTPQPFVDLNGTPTAPTGTSSVSAVTLQALPGTFSYLNAPTGTYSATVSFPDSSYIAESNSGYGLLTAMKYDGTLTPSGSYAGTITYQNNLSAPSPFYGATPTATPPDSCCTATGGNIVVPGPTQGNSPLTAPPLVFNVAPLFATASGTSVAVSSTLTITGYDPGTTDGFDNTSCYDGNGTSYGNVVANGPIANGVQTFTFTATTAGTCGIQLPDDHTSVKSNLLTITVH